MAGTSDAVRIIDNLAEHKDIEVIATTTTSMVEILHYLLVQMRLLWDV